MASEDRSAGSEGAGKPRVRDRIFETACDLFYQHGIREVGVDQIANQAGTNKMSFYRSFASKDELVAEYLERKAAEFWRWWDETTATAEEPRRQIVALFNSIAKRVCGASSRGCALANASVEIASENHPARQVVVTKKREMRRRFQQLAARAGASRPEELGDALTLLMEGTYLSRLTLSSQGPLRHVGSIVERLLETYLDAPIGRAVRP